MSEPIIRVENLGKKYLIQHQDGHLRYHTLRDVLSGGLKRAVGWLGGQRSSAPRRTREEFWALQEVSFDLHEGESIGIIGRNGAGKSTLLKVLSRITEPTTGRVTLHGRVASLLEVGTGFHPELTGRENIFLNGSILGMRRKEIERNFDEIVAFAGVEKFLDTPVKRYSSGMYVRLAFAVAAHLEPEILIVDEVLAVGDAAFQQKCLGKMGQVARSGRTVLFVSHNMEAVRRLCRQALWLEEGRLRSIGSVEAVVTEYLLRSLQSGAEVRFDPPRSFANRMPAVLHGVRVVNASGSSQPLFSAASPVRVEIDWANAERLYKPRMGFILLTGDGFEVLTALDALSWQKEWLEPGRRISSCTIPGGLLNEGEYVLDIGCDSPNRHDFTASRTGGILRFSVEDDMTLPNKYYGQDGVQDGRWRGLLLLNLPWQAETIEDAPLPAVAAPDLVG